MLRRHEHAIGVGGINIANVMFVAVAERGVLVLVLAGVTAGILPALRAAS